MFRFKIFLIHFILFTTYLSAQQVNTLYFMENAPMRHMLNPAFQPVFLPSPKELFPPRTQFYFSLPIIGYTNFSLGSNDLTIKDLAYKNAGQSISFLHPNGDVNRFYSSLAPLTSLNVDIETNLLGIGYKSMSHFWTFNITEKRGINAGVPRDIFNLLLNGTKSYMSNNYYFTNLQLNYYNYTEAAFGYSYQIDEHTKVGLKLKYLNGTAQLSTNNQQTTLHTGVDQLKIEGGGTINAAVPNQLGIDPSYSSFLTTAPSNLLSLLQFPPSLQSLLQSNGRGAGLDMGIEKNVNEQITLSASLTDLAYLHWKRNTMNLNYSVDYTFNGIINATPDTRLNTIPGNINNLMGANVLLDSLTNALTTASSFGESHNDFFTSTPIKMNLGGEYKFFNKRLSTAVLYKLYIASILFSERSFSKILPQNELTFSVNGRPHEWLNTSVSYSFLNGKWSTFGAALGLRTGPIHWMLAADYIPLFTTHLPSNSAQVVNTNFPLHYIPIPYTSNQFNFALGINYIFQPKPNERTCNCNWR